VITTLLDGLCGEYWICISKIVLELLVDFKVTYTEFSEDLRVSAMICRG
jgi:hypothetical protein